ncbi:dihydrolipoyl dehydrogenase [Williamsia soli]|uniref:dihydrolipoyl dehydrogenase n=1 Tax=Williamsia soli TaxID=364929 RepID=UPI001A9D70A0|nr:dihydrolipoyl dehydrogenase [Williamsia soli]
MTEHTFDVVIVGGGSGGYACALRSAQLGMSVAIIEQDRTGGTCLHNGCIPTKALLHAAEVADTVRDSTSFGVTASLTGIDMAQVNTYKAGVIDRLHKGLNGLIASAGITVIDGRGKLVSEKTVEVDGHCITGKYLVLATGALARTLPGLTIEGRVMTSEQALNLPNIPETVVIIGGSVIGVEFASLWRSLGADVTVIETMGSLVPQEDPSISKKLERAFRKRKIKVKANAKVIGVEQTQETATVTLADGQTLNADVVLVAVGREPRTTGLGLDELGVQLHRGWVATNERLRTTVPGIYAVGDLVEGPQLAHRGFAHGIFVAEDIAGLSPDPIEDSKIPKVTYCDPEIASVGLTEAEAAEKFGEVDTVEYNLGGNGKSQILGTGGAVKLVRQRGGSIVGVHMIGSRISEQVGEAAMAVHLGTTPEDYAQLIHAHPTQNESLGEAAMALAGKPLHSHS